jgi:hypothetical protein
MRETQRNEADGSGDPAGPPGFWVLGDVDEDNAPEGKAPENIGGDISGHK